MLLIYASTKTLSDSTVTLYEDKSLSCVPNAISFPVLQSQVEPCHGHVRVDPSNDPSERLAHQHACRYRPLRSNFHQH
jgi:hypothetical protein